MCVCWVRGTGQELGEEKTTFSSFQLGRSKGEREREREALLTRLDTVGGDAREMDTYSHSFAYCECR